MNKMRDINEILRLCVGDARQTVLSGKLGIEAQKRAYDLFEYLSEYGTFGIELSLRDEFCSVFLAGRERIEAAYDEAALKEEASLMLKPFQEALSDARFKAAAAASLHEFAKDTFDIWQRCGIFARRRALKELRQRAGFKLESHRIGNYVAKTFDLMNEAQSRFGQAQQALFAADAAYKIVPGIFRKIYDILSVGFKLSEE